MSNKALTAVFETSASRAGARLTLLAIADNADDDGLAWPGVERLARMTAQTDRIVLRQIATLEKSGELYVHRREGRVNHYVIKLLGSDALSRALIKLAAKVGVDKIELPTPDPNDTGNNPITPDPIDRGVETITPDPNDRGGDDPNDTTPLIQTTGVPLIDPTPDPLYDPLVILHADPSDPNGSVPPGPDEVISPVIPDDPPPVAPTPQQMMFDAVCRAWGYAIDSLTPTRKTEIGKVASELVSAHADPTRLPDFKRWLDKKAQAEQWKSITVNAMKKYWPDYAAATAPPPPPKMHVIPDGWIDGQYERMQAYYNDPARRAMIENLPEVKAAQARLEAEQKAKNVSPKGGDV